MRVNVIEASGLRKQFGDLAAVDGIDFAIRAGEAFGFLGPNGAGKSTVMRMVSAQSTPTSGELTVLGKPVRENGPAIRARLGVVPQQDYLDESLNVFENLVVYGRYFGFGRAHCRARAEELLEFAQLVDKRKSHIDELSGGMKRRLTIARGLMNEPQVLLLDEPTTGLDPQARHILWDQLFRLKERGTTIVLTTHFMDEAEQLCDRLVVVDHGRIVAEGSPAELIRSHSSREVLELRFGSGRNEAVADELRGLYDRLDVLADRLLMYSDDGEATLERVVARGLNPVSSLIRRSSLEDVFLRLTGRSLIE
ncbi:ATP-binding cassette domain-containing protein [Tessaracoccus sp. OH4464_COT-324]|nr:ATP-binding cassette domain-containing protein [Tessaracoccus sp. OH4464_COT-324]RRD47131.1 ATP-binding cassette domain-containing protein [Tessaracoccus sp. OH4464_COT-324]